MKTGEDIESYLIRMSANFEAVGENIWVIKDGALDLVVSIAGPVLVFRVKLLNLAQVPADNKERFFQTLLQLNASEMLHGAYGIEEEAAVVTDALQLENLDYNEFQATYEDITLAVSNHYPILKSLTA
jgi:hypothetical protein